MIGVAPDSVPLASMQKHNGKGDIRILHKHHSRADARNSYEVGSRLEIICGIGVMAATTDSKSVAVRRRDSTSLSRTIKST